MTTELAKDAFIKQNFLLAHEFFESSLLRKCNRYNNSCSNKSVTNKNFSYLSDTNLELYYGYGDSLAKIGRLKDSFDVYAHICQHILYGIVPVDRLKFLALSLIEQIKLLLVTTWRSNINNDNFLINNNNDTILSDDSDNDNDRITTNFINYNKKMMVDPLLCSICEDILKYPVTSICGHTFCRQCCFGRTECFVCGQNFFITTTNTINNNSNSKQEPASSYSKINSSPSSSSSSSESTSNSFVSSLSNCANNNNNSSCISFEQDVLIRRLVEKWWEPQLRATELNDEAQRHMENNALDEALKCCNQSLEYSPTGYKGLLLRSQILCRLNHYQSSLGDADSALRIRPTSYKAHFQRAKALIGRGRYEDALISYCLSICLNTEVTSISNSTLNEVTKLLKHIIESCIPSKSLAMKKTQSINYTYTNKMRHEPSRHMRQRLKTPYNLFSLNQKYDDFDIVVVNDGSENDEEEDENNVIGRNSNANAGQDDVDEGDIDMVDGQFINYLQGRHLLEHINNLDSVVVGKCSSNKKLLFSHNMDSNKIINKKIIPNQNYKLRSLLDRIFNEVEKYTKLDPKNVVLQVNPSLVEVSDFDCVLCCRTLWKPITTPCGHTYCWVCLDRSMDYSPSCPLCMAPLVEQFRNHRHTSGTLSVLGSSNSSATSSPPTLISLKKRSVTKFIEVAMQRFIPSAYAQRQRQEMEKEPSVPVFICTTAFPTVSCPLFVYEPRYRLMVRRAIESGSRQFGIALPQSGKSRYVDIGTILDIKDCLQLADGCSILSTIGTRRFKVITRGEKDGYDTAKVEIIEDEPVDDKNEGIIRQLHDRVLRKAVKWYQNLPSSIKDEILKSFGNMPNVEEHWHNLVDGPAWAWWIIAILPLSQSLKVGILATTSLEKRLRAIEKTLNLEHLAAQQKRALCIFASQSTPCTANDVAASCDVADCCCVVVPNVVQATHHHHHHHNMQLGFTTTTDPDVVSMVEGHPL
uniref:CSON011136 protein n=1 Tax=Culicoides sonorensis TaxID=179676 RepID=A0A336M5K1_CULSO